ncbi:MAG: hypothetical protein FWH35_00100 [Treponema sp.]|nr:hypothetical protein [Treponema sp.]
MTNMYLRPIFNSTDIAKDLILINCTLGFDGKINLLFADGVYDNTKINRNNLKNLDTSKRVEIGDVTIRNLKIIPSAPQNYKLVVLGNENIIVEFNNQKKIIHMVCK